MEYKEIRKFRDGTSMVKINGKMSIVDDNLNLLLQHKNIPALAADKLQKQFPHMNIKYIDEETPSISISSTEGTTQAFCQWNESDELEAIYEAALAIIGIIELSTCRESTEYFMKHYIKTKKN